MTERAGFLFTAFEPSGDALAASVIAQLKAKCPDEPIWAMGGQRSAAAGAELLEETTVHATMFLDTLRHVRSHWQRLGRLRQWLSAHRIKALVPTDSPAANWSICKLVRRAQPEAKIVHLVAPQLWAWAPWRIGKLRRLTDHVLCLLPFEPAWFEPRGVPATFVGHPLVSDRRALSAPDAEAAAPTRLALLPGSRTSEIEKNWPTMFAACQQLQRRHPGLTARVAALDERIATLIRDVGRRATGQADLPDTIQLLSGQTQDVLEWCDLALVVSGTAVLESATYGKPMLVLYNISGMERLGYACVRRWLVATNTFALPNLIAEWQGQGRVIPELAPHFGQVEPVVELLEQLLVDPEARQRQRQGLAQVLTAFGDTTFSSAGDLLLDVVAADAPGGRSA